MKIPASIFSTHEVLVREIYEPMKEYIDKIFANRETSWHYIARIKSIESYVQKIETGRCKTPFVEDFLACTLVVENSTRIQDAITFLKNYFTIDYRRPSNDGTTSKASHSFTFDDLRLYAKLKLQQHEYNLEPLGEYVFEIQVKTFLQHAWAVATHDLIYKTDEVNWAEERIAYQIKATLEHIDLSLLEEAIVGQCKFLSISDAYSQKLSEIISFLKQEWPRRLPKDVKRLAETINYILYESKVSLSELQAALKRENEEGRGSLLINLSPYSSILDVLFRHKKDNIVSAITKKKISVFIVKDIDLDAQIYEAIKQISIFEKDIVYKN